MQVSAKALPSQNITLVSPQALPAGRSINNLSAKFAAALLAVDMAALGMAATAALLITGRVQQVLFNIAPYTMSRSMFSRTDIYAVLCVAALVMFFSKGLYTRRVPWWSQVLYIGKVVCLACLIDGFISFALKINASRLLIFLNWTFAFGLIVCLRYVACRIATHLQWWKIPTVVLGDNATVTDLIYAFHADHYAGYDVHTAFLRDTHYRQFDTGNLPAECRNIRVRSGLQDYESFIRDHPNDFYVISMDAFRGAAREQLMGVLAETKAAYAIVPSVAHAGSYEIEPHCFFGHDIMMMRGRASGHAAWSVAKIAKRTMDITISGMLLIVLLPVFTLVALMLKLEGQGGSVFYGGKRVGFRERLFNCWKFRSMEPDSDHLLQACLDGSPILKARWDKYRKLPDDPRITTRTARFIRRFSLDELPQLWNVLVGDMSLVGPRPILEDEKIYFGDKLQEYCSVRPGLTGLWQVSGRNATSFMQRVGWDSWYVRNWSLWHDIIILAKTPFALLSRRGVH